MFSKKNLFLNYLLGVIMYLRIFIFCFVLLFSTLFSFEQASRQLKIGILRHLSIKEAEQLSIDNKAEKLMVEAAQSRGHHIEFINPLHMVCSTSNEQEYDVIISRAEINSFSEPVMDAYLRALDYFQTKEIPVINNAWATINAQDKFRTLLLAQSAGIQIPLTFIVYFIEDIEVLLGAGKIVYPFFIKNPYGGCGKSVYLIENHEGLCGIVAKKFQAGEAILVEERIDLETDERGDVKDMRLWVVRDAETNKARFVGGAYRTAARGHYLTNASAGGRVSAMEQPYNPAIARFAEQALESIGADVAGIDVARDKKGNLYLIEINISFFTNQVFLDTIGINIWELVMDLAESRAEKAH